MPFSCMGKTLLVLVRSILVNRKFQKCFAMTVAGSNSVLLIAASFIFAVYVSTISTSIAGGDSGEIVAEGCHLGTAHPPGYPLITMIIYGIANWFQVGTVAFRVNVFCALCTTAAALLIGIMVQRLFPSFKSSSGSVVSMGLFAFSPLIWQYAITSEVFPLNTVLAALILYLVVLFSQTSNIKVAYLGALVCGLAFTNQHTILLFEVPLVLWMLFLLRTHIAHNPSVLFKLSFSYLFGLLPYAYLPIASHFNPTRGSWGQVTTLSGFVHHILRRDYGTFQLFSGAEGKSAEGFAERCVAFVKDFVNTQTGGNQSPQTDSTVGVVAVVLVVVGIVVGLSQFTVQRGGEKVVVAAKTGAIKKAKKNDTTTTATTAPTTSATATNDTTTLTLSSSEASFTPTVLFATLLFYFGVFHSLSNLPLHDRLLYGVHQRFWMQPNILMFVWLGVGVNAVLHMVCGVVESVVGTKNDAKTHNTAAEGAFSPKKSNGTGNSPKVDTKGNSSVTDDCTTNAATGSSAVRVVVGVIGIILACGAVYLQLNTWYPYLNTSTTTHFTDYATSILAPLPHNAVLLINYDQQWTSVRYAQVCEGYRADVTSLQLSMMTYAWFESKRHLYPHLTFPGTYHTYPNSVAQKQHGAFTLKQFLDANTPHVPVYLGGKYSYTDPALGQEYEMVPEGMVSRFVPVRAGKKGVSSVNSVEVAGDVTAQRYVNNTQSGWEEVSAHLSIRNLPDPVQFPMETWEWTIGRDYRDRLADTAAFLLERALQVEGTDPLPLVEAVYWLESAYLIEQLNATQLRAIRTPHTSDAGRAEGGAASGGVSVGVLSDSVAKLITSTLTDVGDHQGSGAVHTPAHLLKNTGLAYVHLVRNTALTGTLLPLPQRDVLLTLETGLLPWPINENFKLWASNRFLFFWGEFLRHPDAPLDSQYAAIKSMYETATQSVRTTGGGSGGKESKESGKKGTGKKAKKAKA